jgi:nitrilase/aliphatic nitrilase
MAPHRFRADAHNYNLTEAIRLRSASHAFEGKVFNVGSSCAFDADAIDQLSQGDSKIKELLQAAPAPVSMFVGPNGEQLADAVIGGEGMVVAEIDTPNRPCGSETRGVATASRQPSRLRAHKTRAS